MNYLVFDIAILVILLLFALWGAHRGLILSLCSLVAVLVAFVGALLIANWGAPLLAPHLAPVLEGPVSSAVEAALPEDLAQSGQTLEELLDQLSQTELPFHLNDVLEELSDELAASLSSENLVEELSASLAGRLAESVAWLGLFFIAFVLVLILWTLFSRTLDLVANLPGLHFLNRTGGFVLGAGFLLLMDRLMPHLHMGSDEPEGLPARLKRTTMIVLAVTLHNIPEGMAVGLTFSVAAADPSQGALAGAVALALGMALQNFPEGAAVSLPLKAQGVGNGKAFVCGALSGVVEPVFGLLIVLAAGQAVTVMPWLLAFAAGAMLYVVVEELIPEARLGEHSNTGTLSVLTGFLVMMMLDVFLG